MEIEEYFGLFADIIKKFICYMTMLISAVQHLQNCWLSETSQC